MKAWYVRRDIRKQRLTCAARDRNAPYRGAATIVDDTGAAGPPIDARRVQDVGEPSRRAHRRQTVERLNEHIACHSAQVPAHECQVPSVRRDPRIAIAEVFRRERQLPPVITIERAGKNRMVSWTPYA